MGVIMKTVLAILVAVSMILMTGFAATAKDCTAKAEATEQVAEKAAAEEATEKVAADVTEKVAAEAAKEATEDVAGG